MFQSQYPILVQSASEKQSPDSVSFFDLLTRLVLPLALAIIAAVQTQRTRFWALVVLAGLACVVQLFGPARTFVSRQIHRAKARRTSKRALSQFVTLVQRFGEFVDTRQSNTLHYIALGELCGSNAQLYGRLGIPDAQLWNGLWAYFIYGLDHHKIKPSELRFLLGEFHHLLNSYNNYCVRPVFDLLPNDMRAQVNPQAKASLNLFQQRFVMYLNDYEHFVKALAESSPYFSIVSSTVQQPKQIP
jgi:hypothetical protein